MSADCSFTGKKQLQRVLRRKSAMPLSVSNIETVRWGRMPSVRRVQGRCRFHDPVLELPVVPRASLPQSFPFCIWMCQGIKYILYIFIPLESP